MGISSSGFSCPHCGQEFALTPEQRPQYAGQTINCTACGQAFTVPKDIASASAIPAAMPMGGPPQQPVGAGADYSGASPPVAQYASAGGAGYATTQQTSGLAIASLVCGLFLCVPFVTGLLATIFGAIGIKQTKNSAIGGRGMAIAGLILGLLNLAGYTLYFVLIAAILTPALGSARERANRVKCASNLRQIGQGILLYANDNKGVYPADLSALIKGADIHPSVFVCPSGSDTPASGTADLHSGGHLSYVYVGQNLNVNSSADAILAYENPGSHSGEGMNVLFNDGHVEWVNAKEAKRLISAVSAGQNPPKGP